MRPDASNGKCHLPSTKYDLLEAGGGGKRWWLHHIIYNIYNNERKEKREIKLLTLTTKLFKIMEMEKFYVSPEVEVLEDGGR